MTDIINNLMKAWDAYWFAWALFAGYLVLTWLVAALGRGLMRVVMPWVTARSNTTLDDQLVRAATVPVRLTILTAGLRMALESLGTNIPSFADGGHYARGFNWAEHAVSALSILALTALVNALLRTAMNWYIHDLAAKSNASWDEELLPLIRRLLSLLVYFVGISIVFEVFGYPITALITTAGVASLAVALAAQETLSNMLGGLVILVDRPFRIGDVIELSDGKAGEVVEIGLRSTHIKQFDGNALVVPNKDMANSRVINFALPNHRAAIRQTIGVDYGTDIERAKAVILAVMTAHPDVLPDPAPGVWFTKFSTSCLDLFMSCWVDSYKDKFRVTDELNVQLLKALREAGIAIPFPQQDVHLHLAEAASAKAEEIRPEVGKHTI